MKSPHRYKHALFIFRRDLRIIDNTGLHHALTNAEKVSCCFLFDPRQTNTQNAYRSRFALGFMIEALKELSSALVKEGSTLSFFYGEPTALLPSLLQHNEIDALFINKDYTPFSMQRDKEIEAICQQHAVAYHAADDLLLTPPGSVMTESGTPYKVFTAFHKKALTIPVPPLHTTSFERLAKKPLFNSLSTIPPTVEKEALPHPLLNKGRTQGLTILKTIAQPEYEGTPLLLEVERPSSLLGSFLKFGALSVREIYHTLFHSRGSHQELIRQLYWRDFFTHIAAHYPTVFGAPFNEKYQNLTWEKNEQFFTAWCEGKTGFPIVDAGMRELNETGHIHNRIRLIVSSFLVKDLGIDWRLGERYFAQKLIDYDPAINNGNWQWIASTGCDAQPYFRIFNPWLQQKKYDPECKYIKKWIPALRSYPARVIHALEKKPLSITSYPHPIVNHTLQSKHTKKRYHAI